MNRKFGKENMEPQQPTEQPDHYGGSSAKAYGRSAKEDEATDSNDRGVTQPPQPQPNSYANPGVTYADQRDTATIVRRYTISAAPGEGPNAERHASSTTEPAQHARNAAAGGGVDMMGNHSQRSLTGQTHHGGYREVPGTPGQPAGYEQPLSPNHFAHRMSLGQFYPMSAGASPSFPNEMADLSGRGVVNGAPGAAAAPGSNTTAASSAGAAREGAANGQQPPPVGLTQADQEEELLLNLLITRRQRSRMAGGNRKSGQQLSLAEEILRMRQQPTPMPGMPPLYADQQQPPQQPQAPLPNAPYPDHYRMIKDSYGTVPPYQHHPHTHYATHMRPAMHGQTEMDRIDRSPSRFHTMDARMDMRDFSEGMYKQRYGQQQHHPQVSAQHHHHMAPGYEMYEIAHHGMPPMEAPPPKKKRAHKKKPADMPRRPLSAYNLFFSEERERILKEIEKEEGKGTADGGDVKTDDVKSEAAEKPKALLRPLIPSQKKRRPHRKTHGKISFQDLARMVGERWKSLPDEDRKYYQDLAQEDMKRQKAAMEEYYAKQNTDAVVGGGDMGKPGDKTSELATVDA